MSASKRGAGARAVALPDRRRAQALRPGIRRLGLPAPSLRSLAVGLAIVVAAAGVYVVARETSLFAVRTIEITGGSAAVRAQVRRALAPELGVSLLRIGSGEIDRRVAAIPDVISVRFDRAFPHTLHILVRPERAVLLLRQGRKSFVVSARGRVMRALRTPKRSRLPRLWLPTSVPVSVGETLPRTEGLLAAAAVAPIKPGTFPGGVRTVLAGRNGVGLVLGSGPEIRLGDIGNLRLKLTVARKILRIAAATGRAAAGDYVDVSLPTRPVLGAPNSQVGTTG